MREALAALCIVASMVVSVEARGKKSKEIPTQICERGNLVFEDDFSQEKHLWQFDESKCSWNVAKGALVTTSVGGTHVAVVTRNVSPVGNFVLEMRMILPPKAVVYITYGGMQRLQVFPSISSSLCQAALRLWKDEGNVDIAVTTFTYREKRPVALLFEVLNGRFALTVDGKCAKFDSEIQTVNQSGYIKLELRQAQPNVFAVDHVMLWEALPKDQADEKEKKK